MLAVASLLGFWLYSLDEPLLPWWLLQERADAADLLRIERRAKLERSADGSLAYPSYRAVPGKEEPPVPADRLRIVCWIMTSPANLRTKAAAVNETWLKRCDVGLFMSSATHSDPAVIKIASREGRWRLPFKTMKAFKYVYDHHFHDGDWFLKADDDTYVIMENLRLMLSKHRPDEAVYFGHRFKPHVLPQGYASGGAGYVMSKQALFRFAEFGYKVPGVCSVEDVNEDVVFGGCMQNLDVHLVDSRDTAKRNRFHAYRVEEHLSGGMGPMYPEYDWYGATSGINATSPYAVSFHYVKPEEMYVFEYFVYHFARADTSTTAAAKV